jgi:hypothetical protein
MDARHPDAEQGARRARVAAPRYREFTDRRAGMIHAMDGGLWLHRHVWKGRPMAHLVSVDRELLLEYGRAVGIPADRLQFKPLKDPRTGLRRDAWHWDLVGAYLPPRATLATPPER